MNRLIIGERIAELRKEKGMTQLELANRLLVSDKAISRWERGASAPDIEQLPRIAELFGVTIDNLLRGSEAEENKEKDMPVSNKEANMLEELYQMLVEKHTMRCFLVRCIIIGAAIIGALLCYVGFHTTVVMGFCIWIIVCIAGIFMQVFFLLADGTYDPKRYSEEPVSCTI